MARTDPQLKLRLPSDLKELVEQAAAESGRSINSEIVQRLEASFLPTPGALPTKNLDMIGVALTIIADLVEGKLKTPPNFTPKEAVAAAITILRHQAGESERLAVLDRLVNNDPPAESES